MESLTCIDVEEAVRIDPDRLAELYVQLGPRAAEGVVCRAMEELAIRIARTEAEWVAGNLPALAKDARGMIRIADQIGMATLARVAADVAACASSGDFPALGATMARLSRISDRSLSAIWDLQDVPV